MAKTIWVHQATTRPEWMADQSAEAKRDEIDQWHKKRGWKGFGYHYLIDRDGTTIPGRDEDEIAAAVRGHNRDSVHICLVGGFGANKDDPFAQHFTDDQDYALRELIDDIKTRHKIKRVRGHNEVANKACPGFNVKQWMKTDREPRTHMVQSTTLQAAGAQVGAAAVTAGTAVSALDGTAQQLVIAMACLGAALALWIARERVHKWLRGIR